MYVCMFVLSSLFLRSWLKRSQETQIFTIKNGRFPFFHPLPTYCTTKNCLKRSKMLPSLRPNAGPCLAKEPFGALELGRVVNEWTR